jgi:hypothetical protein
MKIKVEIPVEIDGPMTWDEREQFQKYLQAAAEAEIKEFTNRRFNAGPRMYEAFCRFSFSEASVVVE